MEGQYELSTGDVEELNALDNEAVAAAQSGDEQQFQEAFNRLLNLVRERGRPLGDDELEPSDVIIPPPDSSLEDASAEFTGEGLIPG